jgi:hypothetical protein
MSKRESVSCRLCLQHASHGTLLLLLLLYSCSDCLSTTYPHTHTHTHTHTQHSLVCASLSLAVTLSAAHLCQVEVPSCFFGIVHFLFSALS